MTRPSALMASLPALALFLLMAPAHAAGLERLYAFDCGQVLANDQSRWSPGINVGKPIENSDNCYLIRHERGLLLWDTGYPDALADMPNGNTAATGTSRRKKKLMDDLAALGVRPADISYVAISHTHGDHIGNLDKFPASTLLMQAAEFAFAFQGKPTPFPASQSVMQLAGDHDVFGDGSVVIVSTPGHTPGHQSLMVNLPKTGVVLLSGDAVHFKDNWDHKRIPSMNTDRGQTVASMSRLEALMTQHKAQLWINHDKPQSDGMRRPPDFYE
ncbi:MAG: N-acyl homoserine lactonase family protein [Alphaproteobacteria bacterium]|nr:N-acyl homoserine lactonase family protein [Alphaproteobacteria bacterium]